MSKVKLSASAKPTTFKAGQAYVLGVTEANKKLQLASHSVDSSALNGLDLASLGVSSKPEKLARVAAPNGAIFALIGVGTDELDEDNLREFAAAAVRNLTDREEVIFDLPTDDSRDAVNILEGALLGNYEYHSVFSAPKAKSKLASVAVLTEHKPSKAQIDRAKVVANAVSETRNLVNTPPNLLYPKTFADIAIKLGKDLDVAITVWDEKKLAADGFGGILAVGQGSSRPPRLVKVHYKPKTAKKHLALVGKGITFDTGGISLKPGASMVGMKYDMTGAASCLHSILAIAELGLDLEVTAWLCLAENMPSGTATRPNDVIKIKNGKTVEVLNTDAEGRLVLADGISAALESKPDVLVDIATLTGAARVALGTRYSAVMGSADAVSMVEAAAFDSGELVWHMPLPTELRASLDSDVADIANAKIGSTAGGMLLAGVFLKEFAQPAGHSKSNPAWAHLDIAGTANNDGAAYGYVPKGATGVMVRTLIALAEGMSR